MKQKIPAAERHYKDYGSLKTYWLFSFSDYHDPSNMSFGTLRVFNDDVIMPGSGFPDHPHDTMEIVTIVLEGVLTHTDSMGNAATICAGEVQRMSAGEGIVHSEFNKHDGPVHLYQLWFLPNQKTESGYEQKRIDASGAALTTLASSKESAGIMLRADATISELNLKAGESFSLSLTNGQGCFVYVTDGALSIDGENFAQGDQARIVGDEVLVFVSESTVKALIVEVGI